MSKKASSKSRYLNRPKLDTPQQRDRAAQSEKSASALSPLPRLIQENALLQSRNQLLLMYSSFQTEMPADGKTGIGTWIQGRLHEHGMPSLVRFGPRSRPQVLRRDEFVEWFNSVLIHTPPPAAQ